MRAELEPAAELGAIAEEIAACRACTRLVDWRESVALDPPRAHRGARYWARGLSGFGAPDARLVLVGLAPAAHGGNRTGRMFTGDRSGDFLFAALFRTGRSSSPSSQALDDGLVLHDTFVTAAVRCAPPGNRPSPEERRACAGFLERELDALVRARVLVALGAFAYESLLRGATTPTHGRAPRFAHGLELEVVRGDRPLTVLCSYHPSQRNVFTGRLDAAMLDAVLARAGELTGIDRLAD